MGPKGLFGSSFDPRGGHLDNGASFWTQEGIRDALRAPDEENRILGTRRRIPCDEPRGAEEGRGLSASLSSRSRLSFFD